MNCDFQHLSIFYHTTWTMNPILILASFHLVHSFFCQLVLHNCFEWLPFSLHKRMTYLRTELKQPPSPKPASHNLFSHLCWIWPRIFAGVNVKVVGSLHRIGYQYLRKDQSDRGTSDWAFVIFLPNVRIFIHLLYYCTIRRCSIYAVNYDMLYM